MVDGRVVLIDVLVDRLTPPILVAQLQPFSFESVRILSLGAAPCWQMNMLDDNDH